MDTNRCHRAGEDALEAPRKAIALPDDLREKGTQGLHSRVCQVGVLPANLRFAAWFSEPKVCRTIFKFALIIIV